MMRHPRLGALAGTAALSVIVLMLSACSAPPPRPDAVVPVEGEVAARGDQPITVTGLGQVQGYYTVDVRPQTSGQILRLTYREGQEVRAGQPLAQIDPRPLQASLAADQAQLNRDLAALGGARDVLWRNVPLVSAGLTTEQQIQGYRVQTAQLAAAVAGDRAVLSRDRLMLAYATIRAPISGVAGTRRVDPGNVVAPTDPGGIVTIVQVQPIALLFSVAQRDLGSVQAAANDARDGGLAVEALQPDGSRIRDHGRLTVVDNQIDQTNGTIRLKAVFPNAHRQLWPGQLILARLRLGEQRNAVTVASNAVQRNAQGAFVWLIEKGHAQKRAVTLGTTSGTRVVVATGLSGGETVVTDGQFALKPGSSVTMAGHWQGAAPSLDAAALRSDDPHRLGVRP